MFFRRTSALLRRGKPRPRAGMFPDKYRRVPTLLKPQQGGQQFFSEFLIRTANDELVQQENERRGGAGRGSPFSASHDDAAGEDGQRTAAEGVYPLLPQMDVEEAIGRTSEERVKEEMAKIVANDGYTTRRGFNELEWYEEERERMRQQKDAASITAAESGAVDGVPERVLGADYFESRYGYSLMKRSAGQEDGAASEAASPIVNYSQLDLWGEMPKYTKDMIFLYLVSRRRNTYAVAYDYDGKRLLTTYTVGNRGLKGGDRGFRVEGSTDNGHQVTSMYLNDLLPRIREQRATAGRPLQKDEKVELVVRVMGFYNGRQGAVRAVQDRSAEYVVRYLEDITPFPLNGPKMPRGVFH